MQPAAPAGLLLVIQLTLSNPECRFLALPGSKANVCSREEHRTLIKGRASSPPDSACVKTRAGPISATYSYSFNPECRVTSGLLGLTRHKIAPPTDVSAFLHNQDPEATFRTFLASSIARVGAALATVRCRSSCRWSKGPSWPRTSSRARLNDHERRSEEEPGGDRCRPSD